MSKQTICIDIYSRTMNIWNWLLANYPDAPSIFPPPIHKIETSKKNRSDKSTFTVAEINTSWYEDDFLLEINDYDMKIYPDVYLDYLHSVFGDYPSMTAALMIFDHLVMHEYFHYIRNYQAWLPSHDDNDTKPYAICKKNLKKYIIKMGQDEDEIETEKLALKYIGEMYNINTDLCPVYTGSYAKFMNKHDPTYIDRVCTWNMLQMEHKAETTDDDILRDAAIKRWSICVMKQTESGRKAPIKVIYK